MNAIHKLLILLVLPGDTSGHDRKLTVESLVWTRFIVPMVSLKNILTQSTKTLFFYHFPSSHFVCAFLSNFWLNEQVLVK